jgi:chromosome partitioning protein
MGTVTIAMLNKKGGVGKTSTCTHLAGTMTSQGKRVLLIDNDPQGSLGRGFFGPEVVDVLPKERTLAALYDPECSVSPSSLIVSTNFDRLDIVPTNSQHYEQYNSNPPQEARHDFQALRSFIRSTTGYDYVVIDCPPNFYFCSWSALLAADCVIIPTQPEDYGVQGLVDAVGVIEGVQEYNPTLRLLGYLISRVNPNWATHRRYEHDLRAAFDGQVFHQTVPMSPHFLSSYEERVPIVYHRPQSKAAEAMGELAREIDQRVHGVFTAEDQRVLAHG